MSDSSGGGGGDGGIPHAHHLMPVAAALGTYALAASARALYQVYANVRHDPTKVTAEMRLEGRVPRPLRSARFALLVLSVACAVLAYGYVTALVNNAVLASDVLDPYDVLGLDVGSNSTVIRRAYRSASREHHPDKGGDPGMFNRVNLAYRALADPIGRENFERYGHPDGPRTQTLSFALPEWLLHPRGYTAAVLVALYLGMFAALVCWVVGYARRTEEEAAEREAETSVAGADAAYLASRLRPESTHLDVLFLIATTPENVDVSRRAIEKRDELRERKVRMLVERRREERRRGEGGEGTEGAAGDMEFDIGDDGGWADDVDDDEDEAAKEAARRAREAEEEKRRREAQLAAATGRADEVENVKLEGVDGGVLGQRWVEAALTKAGGWPPKRMGAIEGMTFSDGKGAVLKAMDCPAVRRNLCMTMGRLNAQMLNAHPDLVAAGQKGLIDPTYFKATMEFRQRTGLLLEAALRVSMSVRSYRLAKTIVEAVSMFKIGTASVDDPKVLAWFGDVMRRQYGGDAGVPRLEFLSKDIATPDEDEIATGDVCALSMHIERKHAENFTKQKLALCAKQGIPPQVAMQTYREGWWILVRAKRVDGGDAPKRGGGGEGGKDGGGGAPKNPLVKMLDAEARRRFDAEEEENRLLCAWPFIVSNVAQKQGKVNVKFKAPSVPGKYEFMVEVKSQEFLGADQQFSITKDVLDSEEVARKEESEEEEEEEEGEEEGGDKEGDDSEDDEEEEEEEESKKTK